MRTRFWMTAGVLCLAASPAWAQQAQKVTGQVVDSTGKPVAEAEVAAFWMADKGTLQPFNSVKTNSEGKYAIDVQFYGRAQALFAADKERHTGALVTIEPKNSDKPVEIKLGPLVRVHGDFFCKELDRKPQWTNVYMMALPSKARFIQCSSNKADFSFLLPPGKYQFWGYGTDIDNVKKEVELTADKPDVAMGTLEAPATIIAKHVGKAPPEWNVTDARGVGKNVKLSDFKGKWVMIEFWGYW